MADSSILLVMAGLRGLRAGGVLVSDGNLSEQQSPDATGATAYDPHRDVVKEGTQKMLTAALDALTSLD